jgi:hypothetical protein
VPIAVNRDGYRQRRSHSRTRQARRSQALAATIADDVCDFDALHEALTTPARCRTAPAQNQGSA